MYIVGADMLLILHSSSIEMSKLSEQFISGEISEGFEEELDNVKLSSSAYSTVNALLMFIRQEKYEELCIGGEDGSSSLLQMHSCIDGDKVDIVASLLRPGKKDIETVAASRHQRALNMIAVYWQAFPTAPLLVPLDEESQNYGHVLCGLEGQGETWAPFTLSQWRTLQVLSTHEDDSVAFARPARPQGALTTSEESAVKTNVNMVQMLL